MSSNYLLSLINCLKEEYKNYYELTRKYLKEKIPQKNEIRKKDIGESKQIIEKLNENIKDYIKKYREILLLKVEINNEKQNEKKIRKKNEEFSEFLEKGKKILINNISYYNKLPDYSNKKLKTAKISPLDLINFTLRLSQQSKSPLEGDFFFSKYLNDKILYNDYFVKNKNRFLYPYPNDYFGLKKTILRYDLSEKNRLLPPTLISPSSTNIKDGAIIANKGKELIFKYPNDNPPPDIIYKYSKDPNILPSFFSGEEYKDYSLPNLDRDCIIKVCTCRKGFKDSKIVTFKFTIIDSNSNPQFVYRNVITESKPDYVERPKVFIDSNIMKIEAIKSSSSLGSSPLTNSRPGTSSYEPVFYEPGNNDDDDDEDEI